MHSILGVVRQGFFEGSMTLAQKEKLLELACQQKREMLQLVVDVLGPKNVHEILKTHRSSFIAKLKASKQCSEPDFDSTINPSTAIVDFYQYLVKRKGEWYYGMDDYNARLADAKKCVSQLFEAKFQGQARGSEFTAKKHSFCFGFFSIKGSERYHRTREALVAVDFNEAKKTWYRQYLTDMSKSTNAEEAEVAKALLAAVSDAQAAPVSAVDGSGMKLPSAPSLDAKGEDAPAPGAQL